MSFGLPTCVSRVGKIMAATPLVFRLEGEESPCHLTKVDRTKLYGFVEKEVVDEEGAPCRLVTLAADGKTLIAEGGSTFAYMDPDGRWCEKGALQAVDPEGQPVTPVASSFKAPIDLADEVSIEVYLSHQIRSVYVVEAVEALSEKLAAALQGGRIFQFPFSYRGALDPDQGFLLCDPHGTVWLAVGKPADINLVGLSEMAAHAGGGTASGEDDEVDLMDFGLF